MYKYKVDTGLEENYITECVKFEDYDCDLWSCWHEESLEWQYCQNVREFSGMKDFNGLDLYENDIVKCFKFENSKVIKLNCAYGLIGLKSFEFVPFYEIKETIELIKEEY